MTTPSKRNDNIAVDEDESFQALLQMQRRFIRQIKREQQEELERQCSTARSLGSIATVNEHAQPTTPAPVTSLTSTRTHVVPEDLVGAKRPAEVVSFDQDDVPSSPSNPKKARTFSKFDFDEIYFDLFEPNKKGQENTNASHELGSYQNPVEVVKHEEHADDESLPVGESIFRPEVQTKEATPESFHDLVSIVTDDDQSEDGHSEDGRSHEDQPGRWRLSGIRDVASIPSTDDLKPAKAEAQPVGSMESKEHTMRLLRAMDESIEGSEELLDWNDEMHLKQSFTKAMSKTAESRVELRELLNESSPYAT